MKVYGSKPIPKHVPHFQYSDIPNDETGKALITLMKTYLNKDRYSMRVRGQYLKDGLDWKQYRYGQGIKDSKCLRIYIEENK